MEPRVSLITLGVADLERTTRFYEECLGLPRLQAPPSVTFFVLQMLQMSPRPFAKWAVVDPQAADDDMLPETRPDSDGWLAYGPQFAPIAAFSQRLATALEPGNVRSTDCKHAQIALKAFGGDRLGGGENIYEFLGLKYVPDA